MKTRLVKPSYIPASGNAKVSMNRVVELKSCAVEQHRRTQNKLVVAS